MAEKALGALMACLPVRQAERARVCRSIVSSRRIEAGDAVWEGRAGAVVVKREVWSGFNRVDGEGALDLQWAVVLPALLSHAVQLASAMTGAGPATSLAQQLQVGLARLLPPTRTAVLQIPLFFFFFSLFFSSSFPQQIV